jgi:hypothetical protein
MPAMSSHSRRWTGSPPSSMTSWFIGAERGIGRLIIESEARA